MLKNKKITIIGMGMIGGSIAKAFQKYHNANNIICVDISAQTRQMAINENIAIRAYPNIDNEDVLSSDIIVIATPVLQALKYAREMSGKLNSTCIVTDVCSTKTDLIQCFEQLENPPIFIGGHPMAGREKTGFSVSSEDLFQNATYLLTKTKTTNPESFSILFKIIAGIGAIPVEINAKEHDFATAYISHLPHIVAFTLVDLVRKNDFDETMKKLAAGGFKDITRIASSDPQMWENIMISNKFALERIIDEYIDSMKVLKQWIIENNSDNIIDLVKRAGTYRNSIKD